MDKAPIRLVPVLKEVGISWPSGQSLSLLEWYLTICLVNWVNRCREFLTFRTVLAAFVLLGSIVFLLELAVRCCRKVYDWFRFTGQDGMRSGSGGLLVRDEALLAARLRQQQSLLEASKEKQDREKKRRSAAIGNRIIRKNLDAKKREELLRRHRDARYRQEQDYQRAST
uniref:AlNc14C2G299 protein n=1 Tax=Albugo laibachii Nc14 TaxID=890382 RepID=F0VZG1_9STRA|nr:AlNc14C2G299 [Albugo laibachii Nc14]|eukprot:CCA14191.1 AlNc14C2G299 [Albugo laibachii Nc14]